MEVSSDAAEERPSIALWSGLGRVTPEELKGESDGPEGWGVSCRAAASAAALPIAAAPAAMRAEAVVGVI